MLVRDGETIVIGGISKETPRPAIRIWLKDIPVFGWLFRTIAGKRLRGAIVFITPRVISAGSENLPPPNSSGATG